MKLPGVSLLLLVAAALFAAIAVPISIYNSNSDVVPGWSAAVRPGALSKAHAFLGDKCESCHTPNEGVTAAKCITCHAPAKELLSKPSTMFHASVAECRGCHVEHQGAEKRPIRMDHAVLQKVAIRAGGRPVALDCRSCHVFRDKHEAFFGPNCSTCHVTQTWKVSGFLHPSPKSKECAQCHKPPPSHLMMHFDMMDKSITGQRGATVNQCFACHQTDSFNNIKGVGRVDMH